jgi:hypothetical protein
MIRSCLTHFSEVDHRYAVNIILLLSLPFPVLAAPFARAAYRRLVTRFMNFRQVRSPPAAWWVGREQHGARSALAANVVEVATPDAFAGTMRTRLQRIRRATFAAYATFVVGTGLSVPLHSGAAAEFAIAAAALGIGPALINATPRTTPRFWLTVLVAVLRTISMTFDRFKDFGSIALGFGSVFAFYLIGTNRTLRALYVPLFFIGFGAAAGLYAALTILQGLQRCLDIGNASPIMRITDSGLVLGFIVLGIWIGNMLIAGYAGPVLQIGGPDLARLNVNPYEFALFLGMRTHQLFLPSEVTKERLLSGLDLAPDREGRFRIAEVFCFDSAWRSTVQALIGTSDAILLDLRGFGPQRAGTGYELAQLASLGRLDRTVVVGDATTDWSYFEALAGSEAKSIVRLDAQGRNLVDSCITALLQRGVRPTRYQAAK